MTSGRLRPILAPVALLALLGSAGCAPLQRPAPVTRSEPRAAESVVVLASRRIDGALGAISTTSNSSKVADELVAAAAKALEDAAGSPPLPASPVPGRERPAAPRVRLREALDRAHAAHPELGEAELARIAITALTEALGDGSSYVDEPAALSGSGGASGAGAGRAGGVGLVLQKQAAAFVVVRTLPGTPAAGSIQTGEEVRAIDGRPTSTLTLAQVVEAIRGPVGSRVVIELAAPGGPARGVTLVRRPLDAGAVDCRLLRDRVLYLGIRQMDRSTQRSLAQLLKSGGPPHEAILLDLRGSPGGLLDVAADVDGRFLASGPFYSIEYRDGRREEVGPAPGIKAIPPGTRLAVLVDGGTAAGAEVIAAALQDHHRGTLLGRRTFGMGRVRSVVPSYGALLLITSASLVRPGGQPLQLGVTPDVILPDGLAAPADPGHDVTCPGFDSPAPVGQDPWVARALELLLER